jgi:hypothetical protein
MWKYTPLGFVVMSLLWVLALASLVAATLAWRKARAAAQRAEQLSHLYWELKYQHGELRGQVQRLARPDGAGLDSAGSENGGLDRAAAGPRPTDGFIPLSSLKR